MGTRSLTIITNEEGNHLVTIYRQMDGYPDGHGLELAELCDRVLLNGYNSGQSGRKYANGMGCLAASVIAGLKHEIGSIYVAPSDIDEGMIDFVYHVGSTGSREEPGIVTFRCIRVSGSGNRVLFEGHPGDFAAFVKDYMESAR